ncbi:glycosyltransferase family 2 protein [Nocardioides sp. CGMCC 1.13656]|nr:MULTISPECIES: glycosyltransferase [unclassified Nocardioides]MBA2954552.1 glycosyltransferase family 2 protein [Nocardioides sp. CGMCC 1.13656]
MDAQQRSLAIETGPQVVDRSSDAEPANSVLIVHHNSVDTIWTTVRAVVDEGVSPTEITVVDNSESIDVSVELRERNDIGINLLFTDNAGYAAAVNTGVRHLASEGRLRSRVLVLTHETLPELGAIHALEQAMLATGAVAVGPTLVVGHGADARVWSRGGVLSKRLLRPSHVGHGEPWPERVRLPESPVRRRWLDGAAVLYDGETLRDRPLPEQYFLYLEELDYHVQLGRDGKTVYWQPSAVMHQASDGVPPYYLLRNTVLFQRRWGRWPYSTLAVGIAAGGAWRRSRRREPSRTRVVGGLWQALKDGRAAAKA